MSGDYYETLGVARDADAAALKSAFRKLAMQHHPDRNPGDAGAEAKFKEINEAYAVLSDPEKRATYDRFGKAGLNGGMGGGGASAADFADVFEGVFGDMFGEIFGNRRGGRSGPARGADLRYDMEITLEEAYAGKAVEVAIPSLETCTVCEGTGAEPGTKPEVCPTCGGAGRVRMQQGFFTMERTCPTCGGRGQIVKNPCKACGGRGQTRTERKLSVDIPAGVEDGTRLRVAGEGEPGARGGPRGDLYVFLGVKPHDIFQRNGADLYVETPVPMTTAALGGSVEAPTIDGGRVRIEIPAGAQAGQTFRLRSKGMSRLRTTQRGDMHVGLAIEIPRKLSAKQRALLEEFAATCDKDSHPAHHGFFDKVKGFWDRMTG
jgi:molecular chaperone DnaJ